MWSPSDGEAAADLGGVEMGSLIDVASEDDLLISSSFDGFKPDLPSREDSNVNLCTHMNFLEQMLAPPDTPEQKRDTSGRCNLRKSLAWDSAFFTSEGVLDPEELAIVDHTSGKDKTLLPGIEENVRMSAESNATLWNTESLEVDLCENTRSFSQLSSETTCTLEQLSNSKARSGKNNAQGIKKSGHPNQNMMKLPAASKKLDANKTSIKEISKRDVPAREMKMTITNNKPKSTLRPPRNDTKMISASVKKASAPEVVHAKNKSGKTSTGNSSISHSVSLSKKITNEMFPVTSRPSTLSGLSTSSPTPSKTPSISPCSSSSKGQNGSSSDRVRRTSLEASRKKIDSRIINKFSASSTEQTTSRVSKKKDGSKCVTSATYLKSMPVSFISGSPSRSIESVASESSSSSCSTARKPIFSGESTDANSCISHNGGSRRRSSLDTTDDISEVVIQKKHPNETISDGIDMEDSFAVGYSSSHSNFRSKDPKPSGLRLPSPKLGYFDADKSSISNIKGCLKSGSKNSFNRRKSSGSGDSKNQSKTVVVQPPTCMEPPFLLFQSSDLSHPTSPPAVPTSAPFPSMEETEGPTKKIPMLIPGIQIDVSSLKAGRSDLKFEDRAEKSYQDLVYTKTAATFTKIDEHGLNENPYDKQLSTGTREVEYQLENTQVTVNKWNEKENLSPPGKNMGDLSTVNDLPKTASVEQIEKRLLSLKLSLSEAKAMDNTDLTPFPYHSDLISAVIDS